MIRKILLAVDGSRNAYRAAEFAVQLVKSIPGSACTVITVVPFTTEEAAYLGASGVQYAVAVTERVTPVMDEIEQLFQRAGLNPEKMVLQGDAAAGIVDFAREGGYNLIVLGSRGLGNIKGMLLGSVSHKVMQLARCPVTVVK